jgi:hypothetical protein
MYASHTVIDNTRETNDDEDKGEVEDKDENEDGDLSVVEKEHTTA